MFPSTKKIQTIAYSGTFGIVANPGLVWVPQRLLPMLEWIPGYRREWLMPAVFAGTALWAVMVPEGWSYAGIVGVPPLIRLFTIVPAVIACAAQPSSRRPGSNVFSAAARRFRSGCCACAWKRPERRRAADHAGKLRAIACDQTAGTTIPVYPDTWGGPVFAGKSTQVRGHTR